MKVKDNRECKFLIGKAGALRLRRRRQSLRRTGGIFAGLKPFNTLRKTKGLYSLA